jgi:hypothetical protein
MININETRRHKTIILNGDPYDTSRIRRKTVSFLGITIWKSNTYFSNQICRTNFDTGTKQIGYTPKKDGQK